MLTAGTGAPPGFTGPAAFQAALPNDAPLPGAPYFLGAISPGGVASAGVKPRRVTTAGDTLVVCVTSSNAGALATGCTDTQGNSYLLVQQWPSNKIVAQFVAQNSLPLTPADTITVTWASTSGTKQITVAGCPVGGVVAAPSDYLTTDQLAQGGSGGPALGSGNAIITGRTGAAREIAIGWVVAGTGAGLPAFPPSWTVLQAGATSADNWAMAYQAVTAPGQVKADLQFPGGGNMSLQLLTLGLATDFAPNRPGPEMPPGRMSPAAFQRLPGFNNPATFRFNSGTFVSDHDAGTGTDAGSTTAAVSAADTGTGTEAASVLVAIPAGPVAETVTGDDEATVTVAYHPAIRGAATYRGLGGTVRPGGLSGSGS